MTGLDEAGLTRHLHALTQARRTAEVWDLHAACMKRYGFDRLLYGFTRYRMDASLGNPDDWVVLTTHEPGYVDGFLRNELYRQAPMVHWAMANDGACSWSRLAQWEQDGSLSAEERKVLEFNRRMGVSAGYTISFAPWSQRSKGAIALTARPEITQAEVDAVWERHGETLMVLNTVVHLKLLTLPHGSRRLTARQREVLEWVGDGKTTQDIAALMALTPATIEKHLRLAREALDAETTAQALLKAAYSNQIFVLEAEG
ncbi:LuxR family transcriptional regulator [Pseudoroseicyclus aestuarii]|uniref:LuxR family transcriptional regulator n=1 Tax=Pseudoroseicyclus aestuarii TaxID=1795041 RepID=A0A318SXE6_9RHOB|nr:LuxR family transcriptional regulator [Pseudoroseicyclus aestuarii]PYE86102.1 LuxR family transcriptional regulator [Pseudoroseicyclus aestuarii]